MNFLNKMERKFGKYAIPNLSLYLIMGYILGYLLEFISPAVLDFSDIESVSDSARPDLAACHVDYHSAVLKSGPVDNYNAVLLLFHWHQSGKDMGNFLLQCIFIYGHDFYHTWKLFDYGNQLCSTLWPEPDNGFLWDNTIFYLCGAQF